MDITTIEKCTGCGACTYVCPMECIQLSQDKEHFYIPHIDENKCIKCGKCIKKCHSNNLDKKTTEDMNPIAYAAYSADDKVRKQSSSGGIFSLLANIILENGGIVYGAAVINKTVQHLRCENIRDLKMLRGSKYVQSKIDKNIYIEMKNDLDNGKDILFSGTPCQVGAVNSLFENNNPHIYTISFICHGVPSPGLWDEYINWQEKRFGSEVKNVSFRDKTRGWVKFGMKIEFSNGKKYISTLEEDPYLKLFLKNTCLRKSCYECQYKGKDKLSHCDVLLADWWGHEEGILDNDDDDKGLSLVVVNSTKGSSLFEQASENMTFARVNYKENVAKNVAYGESCKYNSDREKVLNSMEEIPIDKLARQYAKTSVSQKIERMIIPIAFNFAKKTGILILYRKIRNR